MPDSVQFMVDSWQENLNVKVDVKMLPWHEYYDLLQTGVGNLYRYGWVADYLDPESFLDLLLHSDNKSTTNIGGYSNRRYDRLLERAHLELNPDARLALYREAEALIVEDATIIPLFHAPDYLLIKPDIEGFVIEPFGSLLLTEITVSCR